MGRAHRGAFGSLGCLRKTCRAPRKALPLLLLPFLSALVATQTTAQGLLADDPNFLRELPMASPHRAFLPPNADLSPFMPPAGHQGQQGSCVGWAVAYGLRSYYLRGNPNWRDTEAWRASPSFIFNMYQRRQSRPNCQAGMPVSVALAQLKAAGTVSMADFPYSEDDCVSAPRVEVASRASSWAIGGFHRINIERLDDIKGQIATGHPVVFGMGVTNRFLYLRGGATYQTNGTDPASFGHAMLIVGYDDARGAVKVLNSWGQAWGENGFGWIAYDTLRLRGRGWEAFAVTDPAPARPRVRRDQTVTISEAGQHVTPSPVTPEPSSRVSPSDAVRAREQAELRGRHDAEERRRREAAAVDARLRREAELRAEADARRQRESEARASAEARALSEAELRAEADARRQREIEARAAAEARMRREAELRAETEARRQREAEGRTRLEARMEQIQCGTVSISAPRGRLSLVGFVSTREDRDPLIALVREIGGQAEIAVRPWPQCEALQTLGAHLGRSNGLQLTVRGASHEGVVRLARGRSLVLDIRTPDYPSYLYVAYVQADGSAVTLLQPTGPLSARLGAAERLTLGAPPHQDRYTISGPPFGPEMVVAIASASPLFSERLPQDQTEREFLSVVRRALLHRPDPRQPARITSAAVVLIETSEE